MGDRLRPFFCFYGGKWRAAKRYPAPAHSTIIEPFAGAAGYALTYSSRKIILVERDPILCGLWQYLLRVSAEEIRALPPQVAHVDDVHGPEEARWLIGFWLNKGSSIPKKTPSRWVKSGIRPNSHWGPVIRERIASQVDRIRHWVVRHGSYESCEQMGATWFVDPPYARAGRHYRFRVGDYQALADWCRTRHGQVIVCEQQGASWLPFRPFACLKSNSGAHRSGYSDEAIWTNDDEPEGDVAT